MLLIILSCCIATVVSAQQIKPVVKSWEQIKKEKEFKALINSIQKRKEISVTYKISQQNHIPNAFKGEFPAPVKIGNNGKGFDIYRLPVDQMPLLKPDSTHAVIMPNAFKKLNG